MSILFKITSIITLTLMLSIAGVYGIQETKAQDQGSAVKVSKNKLVEQLFKKPVKLKATVIPFNGGDSVITPENWPFIKVNDDILTGILQDSVYSFALFSLKDHKIKKVIKKTEIPAPSVGILLPLTSAKIFYNLFGYKSITPGDNYSVMTLKEPLASKAVFSSYPLSDSLFITFGTNENTMFSLTDKYGKEIYSGIDYPDFLNNKKLKLKKGFYISGCIIKHPSKNVFMFVSSDSMNQYCIFFSFDLKNGRFKKIKDYQFTEFTEDQAGVLPFDILTCSAGNKFAYLICDDNSVSEILAFDWDSGKPTNRYSINVPDIRVACPTTDDKILYLKGTTESTFKNTFFVKVEL